jgi:fructose-specific phosphotransferase system IIC component
MARRRVHVRLVVLGGAVTTALTPLWALTYAVGTGGLSGVPVLALVLGPVVGVVAALAAAFLSGHPAGTPTKDTAPPPDRRPPALPARSAR